MQVACGFHHTLVLMSDGKVFAFGRNSFGQLGVRSEEVAVLVLRFTYYYNYFSPKLLFYILIKYVCYKLDVYFYAIKVFHFFTDLSHAKLSCTVK